MARYTYGDTIYDLVAVPTADDGDYGPTTATSITVYTSRALTTAATDLLVRDGAGAFTVAASSVPVDAASGYLAGFQGPDGVFPLWMSLAGGPRAIWPPDRDASTVLPATTTRQGIVEQATTTETTNGADDTRYTTPLGVASVINIHEGNAGAHSSLSTSVSEMQTALASKADKVGGLVPLDQVPKSTTPTPDTIAQRGTAGQLKAFTASADDDVPPLLQVRTLVESVAGADVRFRKVAAAALPVVGSAAVTTFTAIPTAVIADAASGQLWQCEYEAIYQATAVGGIQVRYKTQVAAPTNLLTNPSFETNTAGWTTNATLSRVVGTSQDGAAYLNAVTSSTANILVYSEWCPVTVGADYSAGAYLRSGAGTARSARVDIQFADAAGTVLASDQGPATATNATTFTRLLHTGSTTPAIPPTGATQGRVRVVYLTPAINDSVHIDAVQLEPSSPIPAYGSTGGSGASSIAVNGAWGDGLTLAVPTTDNYSRAVPIRYPAVANLTAAFGGLGATVDAYLAGSFTVEIGGTGLTNQRVEVEFAPRVADGTNTPKLQWFAATFARLL